MYFFYISLNSALFQI